VHCAFTEAAALAKLVGMKAHLTSSVCPAPTTGISIPADRDEEILSSYMSAPNDLEDQQIPIGLAITLGADCVVSTSQLDNIPDSSEDDFADGRNEVLLLNKSLITVSADAICFDRISDDNMDLSQLLRDREKHDAFTSRKLERGRYSQAKDGPIDNIQPNVASNILAEAMKDITNATEPSRRLQRWGIRARLELMEKIDPMIQGA
jgi:hypothetical protein